MNCVLPIPPGPKILVTYGKLTRGNKKFRDEMMTLYNAFFFDSIIMLLELQYLFVLMSFILKKFEKVITVSTFP